MSFPLTLPPNLQERANLAEQTLQQRQAMMAEKERFQSDVQHFSQVGAGRQVGSNAINSGAAIDAEASCCRVCDWLSWCEHPFKLSPPWLAKTAGPAKDGP